MRRDATEQIELYRNRIKRSALVPSSVKMYDLRARQFGEFLAAGGDMYAEAFEDTDVRDFAVRDWTRHLATVEEVKPSTMAQHMTVVRALFEWSGIGAPPRSGVDVPPSGKTGLGEDDLRSLLRAAQRRGTRDHSIVATLAFTGIRIGEAAALNVLDVALTDRKGVLAVRYGKGGKYREVALSAPSRDALRPWIIERSNLPGIDPEQGPLWLARHKTTRLSGRALYQVVKNAGNDAGVTLTPHTLRHTMGRRMLDAGTPITDVAAILGHKSLSTTAIYTKATDADLERAVESAGLDV